MTDGLGLRSTAIAHFHGTALHFENAAFYLDRGVRHTRTEIKRLRHGRRKEGDRHLLRGERGRAPPADHGAAAPGRPELPDAHAQGDLTYHKIVIRKGHKRTVTVRKALTAAFRVCQD